jgi:hypothetical protein
MAQHKATFSVEGWNGGLMLSHAWHPVISMLSNQKAGLKQQALDINQQLPLVSAPT